MPMFSRRRASSNPPRQQAPPSAAAAVAASAAFLSKSPSSASLSSAAAAAALRSHTTSPQPVGSIQTKRMARRGSQSSLALGSGNARAGMVRRDSNSSMAERTFRSPSPGTMSPSRNGALSPAPDAPPVPKVPANMPMGARRSASLEPPMRMMSPTPTSKRGGRNASVDRTSYAPAGAAARKAATTQPAAARTPRPTELTREGSINFSRPMSPGPSSPAPASTPAPAPAPARAPAPAPRSSPGPAAAAPPPRPQSSTGWFTSPKVGTGTPRTTGPQRPASSLGFSNQEAAMVQQKMQNAANKPVLKKKKKVVDGSEGERLANGTMHMHTGPTGSAVNNNNNVMAPAPLKQAQQATSAEQKRKKATLSDSTDQGPEEPPPKNPARASATKDSAAAQRAAGMLHKQPSVVREDPEAEEHAEQEVTTPNKPLAKSASVRSPGRLIQTSEGPAIPYSAANTPQPHVRSASLDIPRHTHFADVVSSTPMSVHQPPPRSVSPFKSAMKYSPASSVRGNSPNSQNGAVAKGPPSEASDNGSVASSSGTMKKKSQKKSVRVMFDDGASPVSPVDDMPSANTSKPLKRDFSPAVAALDSDTDETMTPRPALPSFGSVRSRKQPQPQPQPQSQPDHEPAEKVTETVSSSMSTLPDRPEVSNDDAVGAVLAHDHATKAAKLAEPLPPQVTSVEEGGYASDSSFYSQDPARGSTEVGGVETTVAANLVPEGEQETNKQEAHFIHAPATQGQVIEEEDDEHVQGHMEVPEIAVQPATPALDGDAIPFLSVQPATPGTDEEKAPDMVPATHDNKVKATQRFSIPGGWAEDESNSSISASSNMVSEQEVFDDEAGSDEDEDPSLAAPIVYHERHSPVLEAIDESDDDDAAFSDAHEDFDDEDHSGFASLNAIAASPLVEPSPPAPTLPSPPDSPTSKLPAPVQPVAPPSPLGAHSPITAGEGNDWSQATAYWSSLSRTKKLELEREAAVDDESDDDEPPSPVEAQAPVPAKDKPAGAVATVPVVADSHSVQPIARPRALSDQREPPQPALRKSLREPTAAATPGNEVHMRQSMRGPTASPSTGHDVHMRQSMRPSTRPSSGTGSGGNTMRTSMRDSRPQAATKTAPPVKIHQAPKGAQQHASAPALPASTVTGGASAAVAATKRSSMRSGGPVAVSKAAPPADDSDSESSFKKKRRGSVSTVGSTGRYNMKRSMRAASVDVDDRRALSPTPAPRGTGRLSIRSLSPNGSFMGRNQGEALRQSLRGGPPADDTPTMRGKNSKALRDSRSPTRFSMSGFSKSKPAAAAAATPPTNRPASRFKSRFVDSDDEDDTAPAASGSRFGGFSSRFADSDDDSTPSSPVTAFAPRQAPAGLAPVRGIPRRANADDDSTDLEDSEDDGSQANGQKQKRKGGFGRGSSKKPPLPSQADIDKAMEIARARFTAVNGRAPGEAAPEDPPKPGRTIGGHVAASQPNPPAEPVTQPQTNGSAAVPTPVTPSKRRGMLGSVFGRRRSSSVATFASQQSPAAPATAGKADVQRPMSPSTGKLQRRNTAQYMRSQSYQTALPSAPENFEQMAAQQQKVRTPGEMSQDSANWPLRPPPRLTADGVVNGADGGAVTSPGKSSLMTRPATSDGNESAVQMKRTMRGTSLRPPTRRSLSGGELERHVRMADDVNSPSGANNMGPYSEKTRKKKKFGGLRKLFGLHD